MWKGKSLVTMFNESRKTIAALVTGLLGWGAIVIASESGPITSSEWLALGIAVAVALGVYVAPNQSAQTDDRRP